MRPRNGGWTVARLLAAGHLLAIGGLLLVGAAAYVRIGELLDAPPAVSGRRGRAVSGRPRPIRCRADAPPGGLHHEVMMQPRARRRGPFAGNGGVPLGA